MFGLFNNRVPVNKRVTVSKKELDDILDYFNDQIEVLANENNRINQAYKKDTNELKLKIKELESKPVKTIIKYVKR